MAIITSVDQTGTNITTQLISAVNNNLRKTFSETAYVYAGADGSRIVFRGEFDITAYGEWGGWNRDVDRHLQQGWRQGSHGYRHFGQ